MMIRNNKGFGSREILTVSVVCFILAAILLVLAIRSSNSEKYRVMEYNARVFGLSATTYQMESSNNVVYMAELLENGLFSEVKNPFGGDKYCDAFESKVEYQDEKKYVTLQCGSYLIEHQLISSSEYQIYKVSKWSLKNEDGMQKRLFYNYKVNGKDVFDQDYNEEMFLYVFNNKMNTEYAKIDDIPAKYHVYSKTLYRTKDLVDVISPLEKIDDDS